MHRHYISSSVIRWYGYDHKAGALEIEFNSGHIYRYSGVPAETYAALEAAKSKGQFFDFHIREKFPTKRLL
jgi:hypothetical protein